MTNTNGVISVNYTNGGIMTGSYDIIEFTEYGSNKGGDPDIVTNWGVSADNTTNGSGSASVSGISNGFGLSVIMYPYGAEAGIAASNYAGAYDEKTIYSTALTDVMYIYITNTSGSGNNIRYARLKIPWAADTNALSVARMVKTAGVTNYITNFIITNTTNAYIVLDYSVSNLASRGQ